MASHEEPTESPRLKEKSEKDAGISELSPEKIKQFENLIKDRDEIVSFWEHQKNYLDFETQINVYPHLRGNLLAMRERWMEMKAAGKDFQQFAENYIKNKLDTDDTHSVYKLLHIYDSLGYRDSAEFLGKVLNHETVWRNMDGSNPHNILETLSDLQKPEAVPALAQYVRNIFSPQYNRTDFKDSDAHFAINALKNIGGDEVDKEAASLIREHPHIEQYWREARPRSHTISSRNIPETFDLELERGRLESIKEETKNPIIAEISRRGITHRIMQEILEMGDDGIKLVSQALERGRISNWQVLEIFKTSNSKAAIGILKTLLIKNPRSDFAREYAARVLAEKDLTDTIPDIVRLAEEHLKNSNAILDNPDLNLKKITSSRESFDSLASIIESLQNFSDKKGYEEATRLYQEFEKVKEKVNALRSNERSRIKSLIDKPLALNLEDFPKATAEKAKAINDIVATMQNSDIWWEHRRNLLGHGETAIPLIYNAIKEGKLSGQKAREVLAAYQQRKLIPIYHDLLLDSSSRQTDFFQKDLLRVLGDIKHKSSIKIIAEFIRQSAENAFKADDETAKLNAHENAHFGFRALARFRDEEAKSLTALLSFSYPELSQGYHEAFALPKIERPKTYEQRAWSHSKLYVRGSALFAEMLGKGKEKVRDLDIFVTNSDVFATAETMKVEYFNKIDDIENLLLPEEFAKLKTWVETSGYSKLKLNLVRIPESNLTLEETFEGEPKLLLWDNALEGEIENNRYAPQDLKNYREGKYYVNPQFPERLVPNGTLTRALRLMDLAERFGFELDMALLHQAEQEAKNSKLTISNVPVNRIIERQELNGSIVLDPTFIKVFEEKKLRKSLLRKFPRLAQIAEEIAKQGGVENYIKENFGEVYLEAKNFVRLYDINLSKSPASMDRQKEFISAWYLQSRSKDIALTNLEKIQDIADLPKPPNFESMVNYDDLSNVIEERKRKNTFLDKLAGRYKLFLESKDSLETRRKIDLFLGIMNLEWPANMDMDKIKISKTLIRLGVHPKNPVLSQFDSTNKQEIDLVISADPLDVLQASTEKPWHSCVCIKGSNCVNSDSHLYPKSTYEDVRAASVIGYIMERDKFVARSIVRAGFTMDAFEPAAAIEKVYGDDRYKNVLHEAIEKMLQESQIKTHTPMITYPISDEAYFDSKTGDLPNKNRLYYTKEYGYR